MRRIFSFILGAILTFISVATLARPVMAGVACPTGSKRDGQVVADVSLCNAEDPTNADANLMNKVFVIINVILGVISFVAVVFIIIGGVQYMTSQGDPGKIAKAKNAIMYSVIGLVVALLSFAIINFILVKIF